jgi:hypothetical protein
MDVGSADGAERATPPTNQHRLAATYLASDLAERSTSSTTRNGRRTSRTVRTQLIRAYRTAGHAADAAAGTTTAAAAAAAAAPRCLSGPHEVASR